MTLSTENLMWLLRNDVPQALQGCSSVNVKYQSDSVTDLQTKDCQVGARNHISERWIQKADVTSIRALVEHRGDCGFDAVKGERASCNSARTRKESIVGVLIDVENRTVITFAQSQIQIDLTWTCWRQDALKSLIRKEAVVVSGDGQQWLM